MTKILLFTGSIGHNSVNVKLVRYIERILLEKGGNAEFFDIAAEDIPMFNENNIVVPDEILRLKEKINGAGGIVIASPEYNGFFTPRLKNIVDFLSIADNKLWHSKFVATVAASPGKMGGIRALPYLRTLLENLGAICTPTQFALGEAGDAFDADGALVGEFGCKICTDIADEIIRLTS